MNTKQRKPLRACGWLVAALCGVLWATSIRAENTYTFVDLVNRMLDLEHLATLPAEGEKGAMWASGDRASRYDEASGKYLFWPANGNDGWDCIRMEGDRFVAAEMEGPGVLWRAWSASALQGPVKIYLDGAPNPVIDLPFSGLFDAAHDPFKYAFLSYLSLSSTNAYLQGKNLYFPIPYQKSCRIVLEGKWGDFYQFNYTTFPPGTTVPTFTGKLTPEETAAVKRVDDFFSSRLGTDPAGIREGQEVVTRSVAPAPGKTATVVDLSGPRAITALRVKIAFKDRQDQMDTLRKLVLRITWDGQTTPAVWCPLGDFFGTAPGENLYRSLLAGMTTDGYYAFWYMPFASRALVELVNEGGVEKNVTFEITHAPLTRPVETFGRFHSKWHRDVYPLPEDRWPDWTVLRTEGRGRFCGFMLHVWNPNGAWWGEGDEKFFVDGEKMPSTFGTGSEDYFGYAWGNPALFARPYHAQTLNTNNNVGHVSNVRWQIMDSVPFQKSFEGVIEKYDHTGRGVHYAATAYWYLSPDGRDPHEPVPVAERVGYDVKPPPIPEGIFGGYRVLGKTGGSVSARGMNWIPSGPWRDNDQLAWSGAKPGDRLDVAIPVAAAGAYRISAFLSRERSAGVVQLHLDGKKLGEPINLYHHPNDRTGLTTVLRVEYPLGTQRLTAGDHTLTMELVGTGEGQGPTAGVGFDFLKLDLVP